MERSMMTVRFVVSLLLLMVAVNSASAGDVFAKLDNNVSVSAQYLPGEKGKGAILILHGFTTTRNFSTVQSIVHEMAGNGHTILAPTLSMNINDRRASVPCDAIHTSTMEDDVAEVAFWVDWLVEKGHQQITLIGHSMGSLQLVAYAAKNPHPNVTQVIATSLIHTHRYTSAEVIEQETRQAQAALKQVPPPVHGYHFVFCDAYIAPPQVYLSYMAWDKVRVIDTLKRVKLPVKIIMGGSDRRFGPEWISLLEQAGSDVEVIEGASHFFDASHEFDLLDVITGSLM